MIYFSLQKHVCLFRWKKPDGPFGPANKSYPEPHELIFIHASSTIESGAPGIDCLALFIYPPLLNIIRSPMNWLPSAVHASSTIESGAPRIDCLALFANSPFSSLIWRPMNWLPSAVHASSTIESRAPRIDCLALFANSPFSNRIRRPMNWLRFCSCILHHQVWSPANWLPSAVRSCVFVHASSTQRVWSYASWLSSEDPLVQYSILAFFS